MAANLNVRTKNALTVFSKAVSIGGMVEQPKRVGKIHERLESPFWDPCPTGFDKAIGRRPPSHNAFSQVSSQLIIVHRLLSAPQTDPRQAARLFNHRLAPPGLIRLESS